RHVAGGLFALHRNDADHRLLDRRIVEPHRPHKGAVRRAGEAPLGDFRPELAHPCLPTVHVCRFRGIVAQAATTQKTARGRSARMTAANQTQSATPPSMHRVIVAAMIGNVLEWFDFVVFGFFAVTIAEVFFPIHDPTAQMLVTWGTFGLAYFVRPPGAIVGGSYTDRAGRKAGLLLAILLMMIGTTLMALTPGYATIGIAAPVLIIFARLLQGFSVGGEFGSAVTFLAEHAGSRRGFS